MKQFFTVFLAVIVAQLVLAVLGFFFLVASVGFFAALGREKAEVERHSVLVQSIPIALAEYDVSAGLWPGRGPQTLTSIMENLEKACYDDRIDKVVLKMGMTNAGWASLAELRARIDSLKAHEKPVYAFVSNMGDKDLYLASACDSIFMDPGAFVLLKGFATQRPFVKNMLESLDVRYQVSKIKEYKAAAEMVMRSDMSPEAKENAQWLLEEIFDDFLETVAQDRANGSRDSVLAWLARASIDPYEAVDLGIVDRLLSWEELRRRFENDEGEFVHVAGSKYRKVARADLGLKGKRIAVVHAEGPISAGKSGFMFPFGVGMGDETMVKALRDALDDEDIVGVIFRVNSPGGLSSASDRIGRMLEYVASKKPTVASFVDMGASGGYMISYRCSTLVASPNSLVGSIGSISMYADMTGLWNKLGVTFDWVGVGPHPRLLSGLSLMDEEEFQRFEKVHWAGYLRWEKDVAKWRGIDPREMVQLARGRVWTGRQALGKALVDTLGGFDVALALLKEKAGIDLSEKVSLVHLPARKGLLDALKEDGFPGLASSLAERAVGVLLRAIEPTQTFWRKVLVEREPVAMAPLR